MSQTRKLRMTEAGRLILSGLSLKQALISSGFAESTARCPKRNGFSADQCAALALEEDREGRACDLRQSARRLFLERIQQLLADDNLLKKTRLAETARLLGVVERLYGNG